MEGHNDLKYLVNYLFVENIMEEVSPNDNENIRES